MPMACKCVVGGSNSDRTIHIRTADHIEPVWGDTPADKAHVVVSKRVVGIGRGDRSAPRRAGYAPAQASPSQPRPAQASPGQPKPAQASPSQPTPLQANSPISLLAKGGRGKRERREGTNGGREEARTGGREEGEGGKGGRGQGGKRRNGGSEERRGGREKARKERTKGERQKGKNAGKQEGRKGGSKEGGKEARRKPALFTPNP